MKLYLVQHGDAVSKEVDPQRPLSDQGRADVERVASFLGKTGMRVSRVLHSGKQRAQQTAELLAASVGAVGRLEKTPGIAPLDPTKPLSKTIAEWTDDTMVVGHLPFMGKLVSRLLIGEEAALTVVFCPGTVICLERGEGGSWSIGWMIRPELL